MEKQCFFFFQLNKLYIKSYLKKKYFPSKKNKAKTFD